VHFTAKGIYLYSCGIIEHDETYGETGELTVA
jgi:hypothetical protein